MPIRKAKVKSGKQFRGEIAMYGKHKIRKSKSIKRNMSDL